MNGTAIPDSFDLARFVAAQEPAYARALAEIRAGDKRSHWMWFVFPQLAGLGSSAMAQRYAIGGLAEAEAYLAHPLLGPRLRECSEALLRLNGKSAHEIFGSPDDWKLHSSMTLFAQAAPSPSVFQQVLGMYFAGRPDARTLVILGAG